MLLSHNNRQFGLLQLQRRIGLRDLRTAGFEWSNLARLNALLRRIECLCRQLVGLRREQHTLLRKQQFIEIADQLMPKCRLRFKNRGIGSGLFALGNAHTRLALAAQFDHLIDLNRAGPRRKHHRRGGGCPGDAGRSGARRFGETG